MRVAAAGGELEVVDHGPAAGRPLICLHGFPDVPATFAPLARLLGAAGWRVLAPYLRGYAPSTLSGPFDTDTLASDLVAVADAVSPGAPVHVIGHDWGALATYAACAARPERFARAITLAVPHPSAMLQNVPREPAQLGRSWYMLFFQLPLAAEWALRRRDGRLLDRLWRDWSPGWAAPEVHLAEVRRTILASLPAPLEPYRVMFQAFLGGRAAPVGRSSVPTLSLHGARDRCVGAGLGAGEDRWFSGEHRREVIPDVGHFLHLERPAVVTNRALSWFSA